MKIITQRQVESVKPEIIQVVKLHSARARRRLRVWRQGHFVYGPSAEVKVEIKKPHAT